MPFWVTLNAAVKIGTQDRNPICVNASTQKQVEEEVNLRFPTVKVHKAERLPYPAEPLLNPGTCPAFCHQPAKCAGKTACPRSVACSE